MDHAAANMLPGGVMSAVQLHTLSVDLAASLTDGLTEPTAATPRSWHSVTFPTYAAVRRTLTDTRPTHDGPSSLPRRMLPPDRPCPPRCDNTRLRRRRRPAQRARSALSEDVLPQPPPPSPTTTTTTTTTTTNLAAPNSVPALLSQSQGSTTAETNTGLFSNHVQVQHTKSSSVTKEKSLKKLKHQRHRRRHQQRRERERAHIHVSSSHSQSQSYSYSHSHSRSPSSSSPSSSSPSPSISPLSSPATSPASILHPQKHNNHSNNHNNNHNDQPQRIFRSTTTSIPLHQQNVSRSQGSAAFAKPEYDISPTTTITTTTTATTASASTPASGFNSSPATVIPTTASGFGPRSEPAARFRSIRPPTPPRRSERARAPTPPRRSHRTRQTVPAQAQPVPVPDRGAYSAGEWTQAPRSAPEWPRATYGRSNGDWHRPPEFARTPPSAGDFARPTPVPAEWARAAARAAASAATATSPPPSPGKPVRGTSTSSGSASSRLSAVTHNPNPHCTYPHTYACSPQSYNHPSLSTISNNTNANNPVISNNHNNHNPAHSFLSPNRRTPMHAPPLPRPDCYAGPLSKRCARTRRMVRRHFVLNNGALSNFRAADDVKPSWTASLVGAQVTFDLRANRVVVAWRYRRLVLAADTIDDARFWAQALTAAADNASSAARRAACAAGPMGTTVRGPGGMVGALNHNAVGGGVGFGGDHDDVRVGAVSGVPVDGTVSSGVSYGHVPVAAGA